jgi:hypothetical protein
MAVHGATYPIVLRDKAGCVEGITLDNVTKAEAERLSAYEGRAYTLVRAFAEFPGRGPRAVFLFESRPGAFRPIEGDWSLGDWQATHKTRFLAALDRERERSADVADRR